MWRVRVNFLHERQCQARSSERHREPRPSLAPQTGVNFGMILGFPEFTSWTW